MTRRLPRPTVNQALAAAALLFAMLAAWPWLTPVAAPPPASGSRPPEVAAPPLPALAAPARYAAIIERPLFAPSRRAASAALDAATTGSPARYRLVGVIAVGQTRWALLVDGARTLQVGPGDRLDDWTVRRVEHDRVVLSSSSGETVLQLRSPAPSAGGAPPSGHR